MGKEGRIVNEDIYRTTFVSRMVNTRKDPTGFRSLARNVMEGFGKAQRLGGSIYLLWRRVKRATMHPIVLSCGFQIVVFVILKT